MKFRAFLTGLAAIAGALLVLGGVGFWNLTANNPMALLAQGGQPAPFAAQFVPRQSPLMVSLLARPDRLWKLRQVLTPADRRFQSRRDWQTLQAGLQRVSGLDYETDLRPWLGDEITFAVTSADLDKTPENGQQPGYLLVLTSRKGLAAREAVHFFWQQRAIAGEELVFEPLSGLTLIYNRSQSQDPATRDFRPLASTVVGDRYILMANDPQVLRQAIATFQAPDISLAQEVTYRRLIADLPPGRIGWMYGTLPATLDWLGLDPPLSPADLGAGTQLQRFFLSWRASKTGLIADTALVPRPGAEFAQVEGPTPGATAAMAWLPAQSVLALGGGNLPQFWQGVMANVGGYGLASTWQPLGEHLALGAAVLPQAVPNLWAQAPGTYALGWLAEQQDWIFVSQQGSDSRAVAQLDNLAQQRGWGVGRLMLGKQPVTAWTQLSIAPGSAAALRVQADIVAVHTQVQGYELFATSLAALQQSLQAPTMGSVLTVPAMNPQQRDPLWQPESRSHGSPLIYLNWPRLRPYLLAQWPWLRLLDQVAEPVTAYVGPILVRTESGSNTMQRVQVDIALSAP
ncbi:DUF3352 domain-containing protein [Leptolyngbya sp. PCC 6406]|uniref:DUF3352 domain-containing protein n=1 Tax=Leptolyngbya sp. PCC 6406 TaxID=1173264 RepID=UPI0002AC3CC4|nr:DUF3352 domain-containing protein [Leptolyngbya sp. PCC 6406]